MIFTQLTPEEFAKFAESAPSANFLQSLEMYRRYQDKHTESYLLGVKNKDTLFLAALVRATNSRFGKIFKISGGPLMDYHDKNAKSLLSFFTAHASEFLKGKSASVLQISPNFPTDAKIKSHLTSLKYKYLGEYETAKWVYLVPTLGKDPDSLFRSLRRNHQRLIKRAESSGLTIRGLSYDELDILKSIAHAAGERHHFTDPALAYYQEIANFFGNKAFFRVCELDGKPIMAAMFINYGPEIVCPYSGSLREFQRYGGAHLMHWRLIQDCIKEHKLHYNFYGTHPDPESGVFHFKEGFPGSVTELLGTFVLPLSVKGRLFAALKRPHEQSDVH